MTRIKIQKLHPERRLDRMERAGNGSRRTGKKTGMKTRCAMVKCEKSKIGTVQNLNSAAQNGGKSWEWQEPWQEDWGGSKARCSAEGWCNALLSLLIFPPKTRDPYARPRMRSGGVAGRRPRAVLTCHIHGVHWLIIQAGSRKKGCKAQLARNFLTSRNWIHHFLSQKVAWNKCNKSSGGFMMFYGFSRQVRWWMINQ